QAHVHHRAQRLAAGHRLAHAAAGGQQGLRLALAGGTDIIELGGFHALTTMLGGVVVMPGSASAPRSCTRAKACSTTRGLMGNSSTRAPNGRSASLTALAMAAGGPMAPLSPMPFWPNSV